MALAAANVLLVDASQALHGQSIHVDMNSTARAKVALFRSLFRSRDDLYARRFESTTTGKSGCALACANEWVRGICRRPQVKCADCAHWAFLPMTDQVVYWHLCGHVPGEPPHRPFVAGIYPLQGDDICFSLAADFDKSGWQDDAAAVVQACRRLHLPAALERSRLTFLRDGTAGRNGTTAWVPPVDGGHGGPSRHQPRFVRPALSQP